MLDIFARLRFLFDKDKDFRSDLAGILGFLPHKIELYKIAFSHSSSHYRSPKGGKRLNNERLEFLGDAILEAVVSDLVFHHFENKREGFLTNTRSKIVQRSMLNELATEMGVDRMLRTGTRGQSHNSNIGGNAFEALIGAIYLDRGYRACKKFVEKQIMRKFVNMDDVAQKEVNFKSKILEYCQKNRISCEFKLKNTDKGEGGSPIFRSILDIEGVMVGEGKGYSKKESEQNACREALLRMRRSQSLVNQIFESKETRTHTEAPIFVAVPKVDEIEDEIVKKGEQKTERRRQQRQRQKERREENAKEQANREKSVEDSSEQPVEHPLKTRPVKDQTKSQSADKQEKNNAEKSLEQSASKSQEKAPAARNAARSKQKDSGNDIVDSLEAVAVETKRNQKPVLSEEEMGFIVPVSLKPVQQSKIENPLPMSLFAAKEEGGRQEIAVDSESTAIVSELSDTVFDVELETGSFDAEIAVEKPLSTAEVVSEQKPRASRRRPKANSAEKSAIDTPKNAVETAENSENSEITTGFTGFAEVTKPAELAELVETPPASIVETSVPEFGNAFDVTSVAETVDGTVAETVGDTAEEMVKEVTTESMSEVAQDVVEEVAKASAKVPEKALAKAARRTTHRRKTSKSTANSTSEMSAAVKDTPSASGDVSDVPVLPFNIQE